MLLENIIFRINQIFSKSRHWFSAFPVLFDKHVLILKITRLGRCAPNAPLIESLLILLAVLMIY
jgi:hypothetical protein